MKPLRIHNEQYVYFVTNRTHQQRFFMLPTKENNEAIRYWLAKSKHLHGQNIEIYAFIFLSNHFHILLRDPAGELPRFMDYFQGNLARAINRNINRKGKFWQREYHDLIVDTVSSEDVFWERYAYTALNAVKSGLVSTSAHWNGISSVPHALNNSPITGKGLNRTKYGDKNRHNKNVKKKDFEEHFEFKLTVPPFLDGKDTSERLTFIQSLLKSGTVEYRKARLNKPALGMHKVLKQSFQDRPKSSKQSPRTRFKSFCAEAKSDFKKMYSTFVSDYKHAVHLMFVYFNDPDRNRYVSIDTSFPWPSGSYPPTKHKPVFM
ncbi:MAG: transposase [Deltaproteobacteria bacterium]|nr:transposase [Deltaproteobacteria bacterium]